MKRYLSHTPEFAKAVVERRRDVERLRAAALRRAPWPFRIVLAALDGYLSELRHMLDAPIYLGHGK